MKKTSFTKTSGNLGDSAAWDEQARQITGAIESLGIKKRDIKTDGYIFRFPYKDSFIEFANHGTSLSGITHKRPSSPLERECLEDDDEMDVQRISGAERARVLRELGYKRFHYQGDPSQLVRAIIRLAEAPLDKVIAEQGYVANGVSTKTL